MQNAIKRQKKEPHRYGEVNIDIIGVVDVRYEHKTFSCPKPSKQRIEIEYCFDDGGNCVYARCPIKEGLQPNKKCDGYQAPERPCCLINGAKKREQLPKS